MIMKDFHPGVMKICLMMEMIQVMWRVPTYLSLSLARLVVMSSI